MKALKGFVGHSDALFGISWYSGDLEAVVQAGTAPPALCCAWQAPAFAN